jgi:hypothetical protein
MFDPKYTLYGGHQMTGAKLALPELDLTALRNAPRPEALDMCKGILAAIDRIEARGFVWRGIVLRFMQDFELWREDVADPPYHSMNDWINRASSYSRRDCYAAMAAVSSLNDVPVEDLASMPRCNVEQLRQLSPAVRSEPDTLEAAKTLSEDAFAEHIEAKHPEQHIERPVKPTLRLTPPVQDALDLYAEAYPEVEDRQGQLEGLLIDWVQERQ